MSCPVCEGHNTNSCPVCSGLDTVVCPECGGEGYSRYFAFNIHTRQEIEVSPIEYASLPEDEDIAAANRLTFCQGEAKECKFCGGKGEVYQDHRGDYHKIC